MNIPMIQISHLVWVFVAPAFVLGLLIGFIIGVAI
jgi:hypothetical protein